MNREYKNYINIFILVVALFGGKLFGFSTLLELQQFEQAHPEDIVPENKDEYKPIFSKFFQAGKMNIFNKLKRAVGYSRQLNAFNMASFAKKLHDLVQKRELDGFIEKHVSLLKAKPGDNLVIIGDIQGGFHSLVRDLTELHTLGIIDDNLRVIAPHYSIIINTNLIGRTPYNLECLDVIITLMQNNPQQLFYVQGLHENQNFWLGSNLVQQLEAFAESDTEKQTIEQQLTKFFNTLPLAIYVSYKKGSEILRVSGFGRDFFEIDERNMNDFFQKEPTDFESSYRIANKIPAKNIHIRALIRSMDGYSEFKEGDGLVMLNPQGGATTWSVFSSPTRFHQIINKFYYDAFAIITLGEQLNQSIIKIYNHDTRTNEPFVLREQYFLMSGEKIDPTKKNHKPQVIVKVGSTMDLTKSVSNMGKAISQGILACLDRYNERINEKHGKKLTVVILDDWYTPFKAREDIDYLMNDEHINTLILPLGTPTLQASLEFLKTGAITVLFPITGSVMFRKQDLPGIVNLRMSYRDEVKELIPYVMGKFGAKNFAFFYQNDAYGLGALEDARKLLKEKGITKWTELPYNRNTTDFKETVKKIKDMQPDALGLFSASASTREMLRQLGVEALVGTQLFGLSFLVDEAFEEYVKKGGVRYVFARAVPSPWTSTLPIVKEYRETMDDKNIIYSAYSLEGYIGTSLMFDALQNVKGPVNHETVRAYFEGIKNYNFKGLELSFNAKNRELMQTLWLDDGSREWIRVDVTHVHDEEKKESQSVAEAREKDTSTPTSAPSAPAISQALGAQPQPVVVEAPAS